MTRDDGGTLEDEQLRGDDDDDEDDEDLHRLDQETLPTGCLPVLTDQSGDPNVTLWKENKLAESKNGC